MNTDIAPGITHTLSLCVNDRVLVGAFTPETSRGSGLPPVFDTAFMVGFMEWACIEALQPYLEDGWKTAGTHVYLNHVSPSPAGMKITALVELMQIEGRTLRFRVDCHDECGLIGSGYHERTVIESRRLVAKTGKKVSTAALIAA